MCEYEDSDGEVCATFYNYNVIYRYYISPKQAVKHARRKACKVSTNLMTFLWPFFLLAPFYVHIVAACTKSSADQISFCSTTLLHAFDAIDDIASSSSTLSLRPNVDVETPTRRFYKKKPSLSSSSQSTSVSTPRKKQPLLFRMRICLQTQGSGKMHRSWCCESNMWTSKTLEQAR